MSPALISVLRKLGFAVLVSVLVFIGNAANLNGLVSAPIAAFIALLAHEADAALEKRTGSALFGLVSVKK